MTEREGTAGNIVLAALWLTWALGFGTIGLGVYLIYDNRGVEGELAWGVIVALLLVGPGISYIVSAIGMSRGRNWACTTAHVLGIIHLCIMGVVVVLGIASEPRDILRNAITLGIAGTLFAYVMLVDYATTSIRNAPRDPRRGFEPLLPVSALPAPNDNPVHSPPKSADNTY